MTPMRLFDLVVAVFMFLYVAGQVLFSRWTGRYLYLEVEDHCRTCTMIALQVVLLEVTGSQVVARLSSLLLILGEWRGAVAALTLSVVPWALGSAFFVVETIVLGVMALASPSTSRRFSRGWARQALVVNFGGSLMLYLVGAPAVVVGIVSMFADFLMYWWYALANEVLFLMAGFNPWPDMMDVTEVGWSTGTRVSYRFLKDLAGLMGDFVARNLVVGEVLSFGRSVVTAFLPYPLDILAVLFMDSC